MNDNSTGAGRVGTSLKEHRLLIDGQWTAGLDTSVSVHDKFTLSPVSTLTLATQAQVTEAVDAAHAAFGAGAPGAHERGVILDRAAELIEQRSAAFVETMQAEAGFTVADAANEVQRCRQTMRLSAEEARRLAGEVVPIEGAPKQHGRMAFTLRVPLGVVAAITPFNSPLNTVTHKVAPAFAAGNAVVLKPSSSTPGTACLLAETLLEAGLPRGFLSVLHCSSSVARHLLDDSRVRFFAFTGSTEVGRRIQQAAGLRRTQMELGSIAYSIVCDDADLDRALPKVINAGYRKAGQVCTSIQVLLVQEGVFHDVQSRLTHMVKTLRFGDPRQSETVVGPLISEAEAKRIEAWIEEALGNGARRLAGGERQGAVVPPTLLTDVDASMMVCCSEVFGPVMCLSSFSSLEEAISTANATPYGLATGIFTNRLGDALKAARSLQVGGVHINETSSSRVDLMPYGGSKESGFGREGPRYAIHELTEERLVSIST